jgi:membrane protease YdiL (CAAX protease family)
MEIPVETKQPLLNESPKLKPAEPTTRSRLPNLRHIFIGKDGLRAGWSLSIFLALFVSLVFALGSGFNIIFIRWLHLIKKSDLYGTADVPAARVFLNCFLIFLAALLATWIMSKIERRPNSVYGLGGGHKLRLFLIGLGSGVGCFLLMVLTLWSGGLLVIDSRLLFGGDILRYGAIWLVALLMVGLFNEYTFRGYLQYTLTRGLSGFCRWAFKTSHSAVLGFWIAAAVTSAVFAFGAYSIASPVLMLVSVALFGMVQCLSLWRTGSLWWAIGFHMATDWTTSFLFGLPDGGERLQHRLLATHPAGNPILSGGTTDPGSSILIFPILAIMVLIVLFALPRGHYGVTPDRAG